MGIYASEEEEHVRSMSMSKRPGVGEERTVRKSEDLGFGKAGAG